MLERGRLSQKEIESGFLKKEKITIKTKKTKLIT
jgi:hypothetical protein